jgi:hypothetical protein
LRTQPTGTIFAGRQAQGAVITGGKTATQILSDETSGSDDVAPSVHFRGILTVGITGIIIIGVMIMMMPVVEMVEWWRVPWRFYDLGCGSVYLNCAL